MTTLLKENKLWAFVSTTVAPPAADPIALDIHEVKEARTQRLLLDGVKDHLIPHLAEKLTAVEWCPYCHLLAQLPRLKI